MAETDDMTPAIEEPVERKRKRRWAKRLGWLIAIVMAPILLGLAFLSSPIGKRFVADQIAQVSPASGLRFEVGRIEGDIYGAAVLRDVTLKDPKGEFLTIPEVILDWRPLAWLWSGIDIRELTAKRARMTRLPELLPGDPDAPILPDFDIRVDRFAIENLTLAEGLAAEEAQRVDFAAQIDIRSGRALIDAEGAFGPEDRIDLLLDAEPDGDRFDLSLDYRAADDGPIAGIAGLAAAYDARIAGQGTWTSWLGHALVMREGTVLRGDEEQPETSRVAAFRITNNAGLYGLLGQVTPTLADRSILDRALGDAVSIAATGTLEDSVFDGNLAAVTTALDWRASGGVDVSSNRMDSLETLTVLRDPDLLGSVARLENAKLTAVLDGPFRSLAIEHWLTAALLDSQGLASVERLAQSGTATFDGDTLRVPLSLTAASVTTGLETVDPYLGRGSASGLLSVSGNRLEIDNARIGFADLSARLTMRGDLASGAYTIAGPVNARELAIAEVGQVNADSKVLVQFGGGEPWEVRANVSGMVAQVSNATIANLAGETVSFDGELGMGADMPIELSNVVIDSERLEAKLTSEIAGGETTLLGTGSHADYGDFSFDAQLASDGPRAVLVFADPLPQAGLSDVRVALAPSGDGLALDVAGGSLLGEFEGALGLALPADAPSRIDVERLRIYRTNVTGALTLAESVVEGELAVSGGGLDGIIALAPGVAGAQSFDLTLSANQARFAGETAIVLANADITASGSLGGDRTTLNADMAGTGLQFGALNIANFAGQAAIIDGDGAVQVSIAGRREDRFALKLDGQFSADRIAVIAQGEYGGRPIRMPRRAVLTRLEQGGYRLAPTQIGFARGFTILEGEFGGADTLVTARLSRMPLRLADLAGAELGLGGRLSGVLNWEQRGSAPPTGNARIKIDDFTRSGLVLSSRPLDVFAVADLSQRDLALGARLQEDDRELGRLNARISDMRLRGDIAQRLRRGTLAADLRFDGPAQSLWRLAAIETFDLTGPLAVSARATGTLEAPRIDGTLASDDLRLQSAISGTDVTGITARGRFTGSRLELTRFAGTAGSGGSVSGSGTVDLADMSSERGPRIDIRAAVSKAKLLNANGIEATITGPLRIVSDGVDGAIAGRVSVDRASWALGVAAEDMSLPTIATREINRRDQVASERSTVTGAWRYLVDAKSPSRVDVEGLGLNSEWGIDIALRGTVDDPRIGGEAQLVRGDYIFAGTRFELTEGRIGFDVNGPIDPRLAIEAEATANGTDVTIDITGNAQSPEIAFSSIPSLPQEEILARLLFGGSVTSLSATDAIQLGAALAALQGGGAGLDPIGELRRSIGLDQLRIVSADPVIGRETGVALGKNLGGRVYVELITDGQGYSATQVEYRITRWLALLGSVSTIGRDSVLAEISRDY